MFDENTASENLENNKKLFKDILFPLYLKFGKYFLKSMVFMMLLQGVPFILLLLGQKNEYISAIAYFIFGLLLLLVPLIYFFILSYNVQNLKVLSDKETVRVSFDDRIKYSYRLLYVIIILECILFVFGVFEFQNTFRATNSPIL